MEVACQRCHETLREADQYCFACGLPQLIVAEADVATEAAPGSNAGPAVDFAGGLSGSGRAGGGILWRQALQLALLVAIPAGVLCSRMGILGWIWMLLAAVWVVRLYARRTAPVQVTTGAGARIGIVTGLLGGWLALAIDCASLWVQRYWLHQGAQIDLDFERAMEPGIELNQQMLQNLGKAGGEVAASVQNMKALVFSPEGRAGMLLAGSLMSLAVLVLFAVVGGALGARLAPRLRRPEA